jgi:threonine/homoserine/homoserine lactone efflux protein
MVPDLAVIASYSLAAAILTVTPGPDMALFLGNTLGGGRAAGFATILGTAAGLVVHACLAAFGLSALLAASATAFGILKVLGVAYLLWLAWSAIRHGSGVRLDAGRRHHQTLGRIFMKGMLVNVLNPKIVLFFLTFLPQFVDPGEPDAAGQLFFLGLWYIVVTTPITGSMVLAADRIAGMLRRNPTALRWVDYALAAVMAAFAIRLVTASR